MRELVGGWQVPVDPWMYTARRPQRSAFNGVYFVRDGTGDLVRDRAG